MSKMLAIDIAQGDDFDSAYLESGLHVHQPIPTAANQTKLEFVIRFSAFKDGWKLGEGNGADSRTLQKMPARDGVHWRRMPQGGDGCKSEAGGREGALLRVIEFSG
jgi:hypothetical protein